MSTKEKSDPCESLFREKREQYRIFGVNNSDLFRGQLDNLRHEYFPQDTVKRIILFTDMFCCVTYDIPTFSIV